MDNAIILRAAMRQSALELNCRAEDFLSTENVTVVSAANAGARKYLQLPFECALVSYGNNVVASVNPEIADKVSAYISMFDGYRCFETPNLHVLNDFLQTRGLRVCFMAEYFLPDLNLLKKLPCAYQIKMLRKRDFEGLYTAEWSNALCKDRKELDEFGFGAYDNGKLIGFAACSADCENMRQIGVDVLPEYRRRGVASALTSALAEEILSIGKIPFYCAAWSNIKSVRNAIKCGFYPAWTEVAAKTAEFTDSINKHIVL